MYKLAIDYKFYKLGKSMCIYVPNLQPTKPLTKAHLIYKDNVVNLQNGRDRLSIADSDDGLIAKQLGWLVLDSR